MKEQQQEVKEQVRGIVGASDAQVKKLNMEVVQKVGISSDELFWSRFGIAEAMLDAQGLTKLQKDFLLRDSAWWSWFLGVCYLNDLHITKIVMAVIPTITLVQYKEAHLNLFLTKHKMPRFLVKSEK